MGSGEGRREGLQRSMRKRGGDGGVRSLDCDDGVLGIHMSKLIGWYTLNMCR